MSLHDEIRGLFNNLGTALRLLVFRRVSRADFHVSMDQVLWLTMTLAALMFVSAYVINLPDPEFSIYGMATLASQLFFIVLGVYVFARILYLRREFLLLLVMILSLWIWFVLLWALLAQSPTIDFWEFEYGNTWFYLGFNGWMAAVTIHAVVTVSGMERKKAGNILAAYLLVMALPINFITFGGFWYQEYGVDEGEPERVINQEETYYRQFVLLQQARDALLPQREGVTDIYFIGFASYGYQDVFMKEVLSARKVLDEVYDTRGRSLVMINNRKTVADTLLASKSNLAMMIEHVGSLLDSEEDILFLYLTSHGSKTHELSVDMPWLDLNTLKPEDIRSMLDRAGIRYRIILVSACYSGGFVAPLMDDYSLIFTAAAKDKTSFGCGNKNDFTYFGEAVFRENMARNYDLVDVFNKARKTIDHKETAGKLEHSLPQLYVGSRMREKLRVLEQEIAGFNRNKVAGLVTTP